MRAETADGDGNVPVGGRRAAFPGAGLRTPHARAAPGR